MSSTRVFWSWSDPRQIVFKRKLNQLKKIPILTFFTSVLLERIPKSFIEQLFCRTTNSSCQNLSLMFLDETGFLVLSNTITLKRYEVQKQSLRKISPYSEFFWSVFSRIQTEYEDLQNKSPYPVRMRDNTDHKIRTLFP